MVRCLSFLILLSPLSLLAQNEIWVMPNAVWHYDYTTMGWPGLLKIEHIGDTSIQGKLCMHFSATDYQFIFNQQNQFVSFSTNPAGELFTYTEGDTVFYLQNNAFQKLFDFSKTTGESYKIGVTSPDPLDQCNSESWTMVTGIGNDIYGYPSITVEAYLDANLKLNGTFNKRFGGDYFFPLLRSCDPNIVWEDYVFSFRCFQDDSLVVNPNGVECEYMLTHVGVNEAGEHTLYIGPNPTSGNLAIQSDVLLHQIDVYTLAGVRVQTHEVYGSSFLLEMTTYAPGVYMVHIREKDGRLFTRRIVLE
jgi:hypothetical protein